MGGSYTKFEPTIKNLTPHDWTRGKEVIVAGKWNTNAPLTIPSLGEGSFKAYSQEDCVCNSSGEVNYSMPDGTTVIINWLVNYGSGASASFSINTSGVNANKFLPDITNDEQKAGGAYSTYQPNLILMPKPIK